jgi:hypothetical protein
MPSIGHLPQLVSVAAKPEHWVVGSRGYSGWPKSWLVSASPATSLSIAPKDTAVPRPARSLWELPGRERRSRRVRVSKPRFALSAVPEVGSGSIGGCSPPFPISGSRLCCPCLPDGGAANSPKTSNCSYCGISSWCSAGKRRAFVPGGRLSLLAALPRLLPAQQRWLMVTPQTLVRWHRELVRRKWTQLPRRPSRPAVEDRLRQLILLFARENPRWRRRRIAGDLPKLGLRVSPSAVRRRLLAAGLESAPRR